MGEGTERATLRATGQGGEHGSCETHAFTRCQAQDRNSATCEVGAGQGAASEKCSLEPPSEHNAAIRLAYIHNVGDVWVSLAPVAAGVLLIATGYSFFDPLIAGGVALWIIVTTAREVFESHDELIWPEKIVCCHSDHETPAAEVR